MEPPLSSRFSYNPNNSAQNPENSQFNQNYQKNQPKMEKSEENQPSFYSSSGHQPNFGQGQQQSVYNPYFSANNPPNMQNPYYPQSTTVGRTTPLIPNFTGQNPQQQQKIAGSSARTTPIPTNFGGNLAYPQHFSSAQQNQNPMINPFDAAASFFNTPGQGQQQNFSQNPAANFLVSEPVLGAAKLYGQQFAEEGTKKISRFISIDQLKYYFSVDNTYVGKKLALLIFPFAYREWRPLYVDTNEPVAPRNDLNAADLYIPLMAFVTYIVLAGFALGMQKRFGPEQLGILASNALAWLLIENLLVMFTKYALNIGAAIGAWRTLAYTGYKFVGMIFSLVVYLLAGKMVYYGVLSYTALAVTFFLIRSVKNYILEDPNLFQQTQQISAGKRKLYLILFIALSQPFIMWWLTESVVSSWIGSTTAGNGKGFLTGGIGKFDMDDPFDVNGKLKI